MISIPQITGGKEVPPEFEQNLGILVHRTNMLCQFAGFEPIVSSGFRSMEEHLTIYRRKGITDPDKIPMKSKHLYCQAVDLYDPDKKLQLIILNNQNWCKQAGIWFEDFYYTKTWVHLQIVPPKSGKLFFIP